MLRNTKRRVIALAAVMILPFWGFGVDVEVVKSGAVKSGIDLSCLRRSGGEAAKLFGETLEKDLERSGWFAIADQSRGTIVVTGSCEGSGGRLRVRCKVTNKATAREYFSKSFSADGGESRRLAHVVADEIVWAVKQKHGIASSRIVMIRSHSGQKDIYMCDSDGWNFKRITRKGVVCISPSWGPDGRTLVYTSFHRGFPDIYSIDIDTCARRRIAGYPGLNAGAEISSDAASMALILSKDGNPDLYVMTLKTRRLARLTRTNRAAEASPSWSPDGRRIVFVSDSTGSPQLYVINRGGDRLQRITFRGSENVAPDWGPDGRIAYSSRRGGCYHVCVMDWNNGKRGDGKQITSEHVDHEDPSWGPDGRHIVYTRTEKYHSDVYILDTMGDSPVRLTTVKGDWYSADWSPR